MESKIHSKMIQAVLAAALSVAPSLAQAALIDFEAFAAGTIIDTEYQTPYGVTINGVNTARGGVSNLATVFDTRAFTGGDSDLAGPFSNGVLGPVDPGNVLIIHEHPSECNGSVCTDPDDEGRRPAGYFDIAFGGGVTLNSIDFFDIEGPENGTSPNNLIQLFDEFNVEITPNTFYTPGTGGDNTWGRLEFATSGVHAIRIRLGGSGAIDNIDFSREVPVPATPALLIMALYLLRRFGSRRH